MKRLPAGRPAHARALLAWAWAALAACTTMAVQACPITDWYAQGVADGRAGHASDRLGGHLVSGHVDGVGEVVKFEKIGESHELVIKAPKELAKYIARKGSITVDGVSLTTNRVKGRRFSINLIPHTVAVTTLKRCKAGGKVNLEVDLIARYVERMLNHDAPTAQA